MSSPSSPTPSESAEADDAERKRRVAVIAPPDTEAAREFVGRFDDTADVDAELVETTNEDEVAEAVERAVDDGVGTIASVGGDGALNLIVGGLLDRADGSGGVTVVPVRDGTVNLVSKTIGLDTLEATVDAVVAGRARSIDVGRTEQGVFVLNSSSGYDAAVIGDAADHGDAALGQLKFAQAGLKRLRRDSPKSVTVTCDGEEVFDGRAMSVILMNIGQRASDGFDVAPDAEFDDGVLDVAIVRVASIPAMLKTIVQLAFNRPIDRTDLVRAQGAQIDIEWAHPVSSQRDGDADDPVRTLSVQVLPAALRIHHA